MSLKAEKKLWSELDIPKLGERPLFTYYYEFPAVLPTSFGPQGLTRLAEMNFRSKIQKKHY